MPSPLIFAARPESADAPIKVLYARLDVTCNLDVCACVSSQDFVGVLSVFSKRASREDRLRFIFTVYDMDGDGHVATEDLELMLRQLAGRSLRCSCCLLALTMRFISPCLASAAPGGPLRMLGLCNPSALHTVLHVRVPLICSLPSLMCCSEEHIAKVVQKALQEASVPSSGLSYDDFKHVLADSPLQMHVDVPSDV